MMQLSAVPSQYTGLVIVGGGPAGLAPLLAAHQSGDLAAMLARGVVIVESTDRLGCGSIGGYGINSDSSGLTFVDCLTGDGDNALTQLAGHPMVQALAAAGDGAVPLRTAGAFLELVGQAIHEIVTSHPAGQVLLSHEVTSVAQVAGGWRVTVRNRRTGELDSLVARNVVAATGAEQPMARLSAESVGGVNLVERCAGRLLQSGAVVTEGGLDRVAALLAGRRWPRVAIVGGSTSAMSVAHALLHRMPQVSFGPGGITLLHRRPLRVYYPTRDSALAEGYTEWTEQDVCQVSGKVFRFAGLRLDSRELVMQARGIGGRPPEPRLHLHSLQDIDPAALAIMDEADLVIAALGYRPRALPVFDRSGQKVRLLADTGPQQPMVDGACRILDAGGLPVPGLFGLGLGAGFMPRGRLGGEASFRGQANGLWLWQHDVGSLIVEAVLATPDAPLEQLAAVASVHAAVSFEARLALASAASVLLSTIQGGV